MSKLYSITFCGDVLSEESYETIEQKLVEILGENFNARNRLFSGDEIVLKNNLSLDAALDLKMQLEKIGLMVALTDNSSDLYTEAKTNFVRAKVFGLGLRGRLGRLQYIDGMAAYSIAFIMALFILFYYVLPPILLLDELVSTFLLISLFLFYLYQLVTLRLSVLRLHDLNLSGWLVILLFFPGINFLMYLYLICGQGTEETNRYGEVPEGGTCWGLFYFLVIPIGYIYLLFL